MRVHNLLQAAFLCAVLAACGTMPAAPAAVSPAASVPPSANAAGEASANAAGEASANASPPAEASASSQAVPASSAPAASVPALPKELLIPSIHVDAPVEQVGTTPDGAMAAPAEWNDAGWYKGGYRPGQPGNSVIAGHLDSTTDKAIFWDLNKLKSGDQVVVKDEDGSQLTFMVTGSEVYPFDQAPLQKIFGPSDAPMLNLVTCDGTFDRASKNYNERLVVYTKLAGS